MEIKIGSKAKYITVTIAEISIFATTPVLAASVMPLARDLLDQKGIKVAIIVKYANKSLIFPHIPNSSADNLLIIIIEKIKPVSRLTVLEMKSINPAYRSLILLI